MIRQNKGSKKIRYVVKDSERQGRDQGRTEDRGLGARAALGSQRFSTATHTTTRYDSYGSSATQYEPPQRTPTPGTVPREIRPTGGRYGATGGVAGASVPSVTGSWRDKQHGGLGRGRSPATGMASGQGLYRTTTGRDAFPTTPGRSGYQQSRRTASPMRSTPGSDTRRGTPQAGQGDRMDGGFVLVQGEMEEMKRGRYGNFIRSSTPAHRVGTPDKHAPSAYSKSLNTPSFEPREAQKSRSADVPPPQTVRHSGITQRGFSTQPAPETTTTTTKDDRPKGAISAEMPLGTTTSMTESISEGYVVVPKTSGQESQAEDSSNVGVRDDVRAKEEDKPAKGEETKDIRAPHKRSWNEAIGTDDNAKEGILAPQSKEVEDSSKITVKDDKVGDGAKVKDRPTEREENKDNRDEVGAKVKDKPTKGQEDKDYRVGDGAKVEDKLKPTEREENKHSKDDVFAKDEDKPTEEDNKDPSSPHKRSWDEAIGTEDSVKEGTLETQTEELSTVPDTIPSQAKTILVTPPPPQSKVKIRRTSSEEAPISTDLPPVEKEEGQVEPPESLISQDIFKKNHHRVRALETEGEEEMCQKISPAPEKPPMPEDDMQVKPKASVVTPIHPPEAKVTTKLSSGTDTQSQPTASYKKEETILGAKPPVNSQDVEAPATVSSGSQPTVSYVEEEDKLVEETVKPFQIKAKATVVPQDPSPTKVKVTRKSSLESQPLPEFQTIDKLECEVKPQEPLIKTDPLLKNQQQVKVQTTDEEEETLETFGPSGQKPERPADAVPSRAKASLVATPACPDVTASVIPSAGEGQGPRHPPHDDKQIEEQPPDEGSAHPPVLPSAGRPPVDDVTTFQHGSTLPYPSSDQPTMPTASQPLHAGAQLPPPPAGLISSPWQYNDGVGQPVHDPSYPPGAPYAPYPPGPTSNVPYAAGPLPDAPQPPGTAPDAPYLPGRGPDAPYPPLPGRAPDAPYPPLPGSSPDAPYPPGRASDAPYPPGRAADAPYPPPPGRASDAPYPPPPGRAPDAPYPPLPGSSPDAPYPPGRAADDPYPPPTGRAPDAPYPPDRAADAPYPPPPGRAPDATYPPPPGKAPDAPYPPGRAADDPYPPPPGRAPDAPYPPGRAPDAPYPSGPAPYPPASSPSPSPFYTPPGGAFPYPGPASPGESRAQEQSSPGSPYPPPHPAFPQRHDPAFPPQLPQGPYPPYPPVHSVYPPQSPYDPYQPSQTTGHLPYPPADNIGYPPPQPATAHHPGQPAQTSQIGPERSSGEAQPDAFHPSVPLQPPPPIGLDFVSPPMPPIGQQPAPYDPTIRETDILSPPYTSEQRQQPFDGTVPPESRESTDDVSKPVDQLSSEELEKRRISFETQNSKDIRHSASMSSPDNSESRESTDDMSKPVDQLSSEELEKRRVSFETQNSKDIRHSAPMSPPDKAVLPWRPIEEIISPKPGSIPIPLPWTPSPTQSPEKQQAFDFGGASRRHVTVKEEIVEEECDHRQTKQQATGRISDTRESTEDANKSVSQLSSEELEKQRVGFETQNSKDIRHSAPMSPPDKAVLPWRPIEEIISPKPGSIPIPLPWTPSPTQSPEKQQAFDFGGASRRHVTVKKAIVEEECDHRQTKEQATGRISDTRESIDDVNKPVNQLSSEEVEKRRASFETQNSKDIRHSAPMSPPDKAVLPWRPIEEIISPRPGSIPIPLPWTPSPTQSPEKQQAFDFGGASRRHVTVKEEIVEEEYDHHQTEQPTTTLISDTESGTLQTSYTFSEQDMPTESEKITAEETQDQSKSQSGQLGSVKAEEEYNDGVVPSGYDRHDKEKASKSKIPTPLARNKPQEKQNTVRGHTSQTKRHEELLHSPPMSPPDKAVLPWRPIEEIISPRQGSVPIPLPWTPTPSPEKQKAFDFSGASRRHVTATEEVTEQDDDLQTKQPPTTLISDTKPGALCTSYTLSEQNVPSKSKQTPAEVSEDQSKNSGQPGFAEAEYQSGVVPPGYDTSPGKEKAPTSKVKDDTSHNSEQDDLGPSSPEVEPLSPQQPVRPTETEQYSSPMSPPNKAVLPWEPLENIISPRPGSIAIPLPWTPTASPAKQRMFEFGGATRKHVSVTEGVVEEDNDRWTKLPATTLVSDTETGALGSSYTLSDQDMATESEQTTTEVTEDQSTKSSQPVSAQAEDEYQAGVVPSGYDTSDKSQEPHSTAKGYTPKGMVQDLDDPSSPEVEPLSPYKSVRPTQMPLTRETEGSPKRKFFPRKSEGSSERTSSSEVEPVTPESPMSPPYRAVVVWRSREEILSPRISSVVIPLPWSPLPQSPTRVRQLNKKKATKREQGLVEGTTIFEEEQSMKRLANVVDIPQREEVALSTAFVPSQPPNHGDVDNELNKQRAAAREPGLVEETTSFEAEPRMTNVANVADVSPHEDVALATAFVSSQPPQHRDGDNDGDVFYDAPDTAQSGQPAKQKPTRQSKIPTFQSKSPPPSAKSAEGPTEQRSPEQARPEHSEDFSQQSPSSSKIPRGPSKIPTSPTRRADSPPPPSRTPKSPTRKSSSPSRIPGLAKPSGIPTKIPLKYSAPSPRDDEYAGTDIAGEVPQVDEHEREPRPGDEMERQDVKMVKEEVRNAANLQQEPDQQRENQEVPDSGDGQKGSEDERERYEIPEDLERIDEEEELSKDEGGYYGDDDAESDRSEGKGWRGRVLKKRSSKEDLLTTDEDKEFEEDVKTAASQRRVPPKTLDLGTSRTPTRQQTWPSPMSPADKALLLWKPREDILSPKPGSIVIPLPWSPTKKPPSPMTPRSRKRFHPPLRQLQKVLKENTLDVGPMPTASYLGVSIVPVTTHYIVTGFVFSEDSRISEAPSPVEVHEQSAHSEDDSWVMVEESDDDMADLGAAGYTGHRQDDESFCEPPLSREEQAAVKRAVHTTVQEFFGEEAEEEFY